MSELIEQPIGDPVEQPNEILPISANYGHTTLACYMHATEDAVKWWHEYTKTIPQDAHVAVKDLGMESDRAMLSAMGQRITAMCQAAHEAIQTRNQNWNETEWDGKPVERVINLDSFELDETLPFETQYPNYLYIERWTSVVATKIHKMVVMQQAQRHAVRQQLLGGGNGMVDPKEFFKKPFKR